MPQFRSAPNGGAQVVLDAVETSILRQLTGELRALLTSDRVADDPVLARLFPDAYDKPEDEANYRDLIGDDLDQHKLQALDTVSVALVDGGADLVLEGDDLQAWLQCLTDLRLAIGTRLDVDERRMAEEVQEDDPDAQALSVMHWLGHVQEGILRAVG